MEKKNKPSAEELFKDYVPESVEYDPDIDGSDEHMIRDDHLAQKEQLKDTLTKLKEKKRGNKKAIR